MSALLLVGINYAFAQGFGQNKVQYKDFDWRYIQSEHFDVYFYEGGYDIARFTAEVADSMGETVSMPWSISVVGSFGTIEVNLEAGAMDSGEYGYNFGDSLHEVELIATFEGAAQDLVLSVTGYDIDSADEVAVYSTAACWVISVPV